MNPYAELDVPPTADDAAIKRAYRKAAKRAHPDAGGSPAQFETVNRAFLVLSDPGRRARYDRDGVIEDKPVDNALANALEVLSTVLDLVLTNCVENQANPAHFDMVASMKDRMKALKSDRAKQRKQMTEAMNWFDEFGPRFSTDGAPNHMASIIRAKVIGLRQQMAKLDAHDVASENALQILHAHVFRRDSVSMQDLAARVMSAGTGNTSTSGGYNWFVR